MPDKTSLTDLDWLEKVWLPILTFIVGFFVSRFTLSKKERLDQVQVLQKRGEELSIAIAQSADAFIKDLAFYAKLDSPPTVEDFIRIALSGEAYFLRVKNAVEAAFQEAVPLTFVTYTLIPAVKDVQERSIPKFYQVLDEIQRKRGFRYAESRRQNYDLIASFYEKHCMDVHPPFEPPPRKPQKTKG
jgi:uncharacterized membrane protein YoaK (UPF0700 family)